MVEEMKLSTRRGTTTKRIVARSTRDETANEWSWVRTSKIPKGYGVNQTTTTIGKIVGVLESVSEKLAIATVEGLSHRRSRINGSHGPKVLWKSKKLGTPRHEIGYAKGSNPFLPTFGIGEFIQNPTSLQDKPKKDYNIESIRVSQSTVRLYVKADSGKRRNTSSSLV